MSLLQYFIAIYIIDYITNLFLLTKMIYTLEQKYNDRSQKNTKRLLIYSTIFYKYPLEIYPRGGKF